MATRPERRQLIVSPVEQARRRARDQRKRQRRLQHRSFIATQQDTAPALRDCPAPNNDIPWTSHLPFLWEFSFDFGSRPDWSVIPDLQGVDVLKAFPSQWVPVAASSPAFFAVNALIAEAVATRSSADCRELYRLTWIKHCALHLINQGLRNAQTQVADDMILCVATMVYYEWFWESKHMSHVHHQGLKRMVSMRGGLAALGDPRLIACFSNAIAYLSGQAPVLAAPDEAFAYMSRVDHPVRFALRSRHPQMNQRHHEQYTMLLGLWNPAQRLIDMLQRILALAAMPVRDIHEFTIALEESRHIEEALLACHAPYRTAIRGASEAEGYEVLGDQLYALVRLVMFVVLHTYSEAKIGGQESKLDHAVMSLGTMPLKKLAQAEPLITMWSLYMAGPRTAGFIRAGWVEMINECSAKLELQNEWPAVKGVLEQICFIGELHNGPCAELCRECSEAQTKSKPADGAAEVIAASCSDE